MLEQIKPILLIVLFIAVGVWAANLAMTVPYTGAGLIAGIVSAGIFFYATSRATYDQRFLLRIFMLGLGLRWLVGLLIYWKGLQSLAPDALTYDIYGYNLHLVWTGELKTGWLAFTNVNRSGWGMYYYVAAIYSVFGRSLLATQLVNCALGAYTSVLVYQITMMVYPQVRVARMASTLVAVAPSMLMWTAQGLKEAPITFCLATCTYSALKLCRKLELRDVILLLTALFCLFTLRHYVFYITFVAVAGALLFSTLKVTPLRALQGFILCFLLCFIFVYLGAGKIAQSNLDLNRIQAGRKWSAGVSGSGYGGDVDITDAPSALAYLPLGIIYVLFAPFPWMIQKLSQAITLPEMVVWWAAAPLLARGYWFAIRKRLLEMLPLCAFTFGLTIIYAFLQTNVGTAHRQRTQLFIYFAIFISIGWEQWQTARQEKKTSRFTWRSPRLAAASLQPLPRAQNPTPLPKITPEFGARPGA